MARILKCDKCGVVDDPDNPVYTRNHDHEVFGDDVTIRFSLPEAFRYRDVCHECVTSAIRPLFRTACELIAPFRPERVAGFVQDVEVVEAPLSKKEQAALVVLSRRLLKA